MNESNFGKGARFDTPDKRDFRFERLGRVTAPFDWNKGYDIEVVNNKKLSVKDQNGSYSCGGQAWASYVEAIQGDTENSAKFIYEQTNAPGGGSDGRSNSALIKNQGVAEESICPSYENSKPPSEVYMVSKTISPKMRENALIDRAISYASVLCDIESVAQAIQANKGVVIGITGQNNGTWLSPFPGAPTNTSNLWYHWVYAGKAKIINGRKYIGILNSWGKSTGDQGWQWISENYFRALDDETIFACWSLVLDLINKHNFLEEMYLGDSNDEVKSLQKCLKSIGLFPLDIEATGFYGNSTKTAVFEFQQKYVIKNLASWIAVNWNRGRSVRTLTLSALNKLFG